MIPLDDLETRTPGVDLVGVFSADLSGVYRTCVVIRSLHQQVLGIVGAGVIPSFICCQVVDHRRLSLYRGSGCSRRLAFLVYCPPPFNMAVLFDDLSRATLPEYGCSEKGG